MKSRSERHPAGADDLTLVYEGKGTFRTALRRDLEAATERFGQGELITVRAVKARSLRQHRWFFSMIADAFDNQSSGPLFDSPERLRKWLLIQVGHCTVQQFDPGSITPAVARWLRQTYDDIDFSTDGRAIYAKVAKSISFKKADSLEMTRIADEVIDVLCAEIVPGSTRKDWEPYIPGRAKKAA